MAAHRGQLLTTVRKNRQNRRKRKDENGTWELPKIRARDLHDLFPCMAGDKQKSPRSSTKDVPMVAAIAMDDRYYHPHLNACSSYIKRRPWLWRVACKSWPTGNEWDEGSPTNTKKYIKTSFYGCRFCDTTSVEMPYRLTYDTKVFCKD